MLFTTHGAFPSIDTASSAFDVQSLFNCALFYTIAAESPRNRFAVALQALCSRNAIDLLLIYDHVAIALHLRRYTIELQMLFICFAIALLLLCCC
jgi:hypothetical protein